jgi:hypothetical protein
VADLTPRECLEPPYGTGDLGPRALWPQAFTATGGGIADVETALTVYLAEGYARALGQADPDKKNESAHQWARYRSFRQAYERMLVSASTVSMSDGQSASVLLTQIQDTKAYMLEALAASDALIGAVVVPDLTFVGRPGSASVRVEREW